MYSSDYFTHIPADLRSAVADYANKYPGSMTDEGVDEDEAVLSYSDDALRAIASDCVEVLSDGLEDLYERWFPDGSDNNDLEIQKHSFLARFLIFLIDANVCTRLVRNPIFVDGNMCVNGHTFPLPGFTRQMAEYLINSPVWTCSRATREALLHNQFRWLCLCQECCAE